MIDVAYWHFRRQSWFQHKDSFAIVGIADIRRSLTVRRKTRMGPDGTDLLNDGTGQRHESQRNLDPKDRSYCLRLMTISNFAGC